MEFLKKLLIIPPILIGIAVFMYAKSGKKDPSVIEAAETARKVRVVNVQEVSVVPKVHGFGTVAPGKEWVAIAQVSGEIVKVHPALKKGAILKGGTTIVTISPVDFELAVAQAKANIRSTEARIDELAVTSRNTQAVLDLEKQSLKIREGELARQRALVNKGTVSRTAFDRERRDTFVQRKKVQDLENALRLIPTQTAVQKEQKKVFEAQLRSAELNLARTRIVLPFDARISEVDAEVAQFAQAGKTLARADGVASAEIEAQIPMGQFMRFLKAASGGAPVSGIDSKTVARMIEKLGLKVKINLDTGGRQVSWDARLARISDTIDPKTRTVGVIAVVDNAYAQAVPGERPPLAKGLFVKMQVSANAKGKYLVVPRQALKGQKLYVVDGESRLEIRPVVTGLVQDDFVVVTKGLAAGEKVVVSDMGAVLEKMLLAPVVDSSLSRAIALQAANKPGQGQTVPEKKP